MTADTARIRAKAENRARMPWVAALVNDHRKHFPYEFVLKWAIENGCEIGEVPEEYRK